MALLATPEWSIGPRNERDHSQPLRTVGVVSQRVRATEDDLQQNDGEYNHHRSYHSHQVALWVPRVVWMVGKADGQPEHHLTTARSSESRTCRQILRRRSLGNADFLLIRTWSPALSAADFRQSSDTLQRVFRAGFRVGRCSTADESHAEPRAPITAGLPVTQAQFAVRAHSFRAWSCASASLAQWP